MFPVEVGYSRRKKTAPAVWDFGKGWKLEVLERGQDIKFLKHDLGCFCCTRSWSFL